MDQPGVCFVCGCTDDTPCMILVAENCVKPCSWANKERTLCDNPDCLAEAFSCPTCGISLDFHTSFMEAGCLIREARAVFHRPDPLPFLMRRLNG
jgi:hypothetical protein